MIDLGKAPHDGPGLAYPTMGDRKPGKKEYRTISFPLEVFEGKNVKLGDKLCVEIVGVVKGITQSEYCNEVMIEAHEGEVESSDEESSEKKVTLLGGK